MIRVWTSTQHSTQMLLPTLASSRSVKCTDYSPINIQIVKKFDKTSHGDTWIRREWTFAGVMIMQLKLYHAYL